MGTVFVRCESIDMLVYGRSCGLSISALITLAINIATSLVHNSILATSASAVVGAVVVAGVGVGVLVCGGSGQNKHKHIITICQNTINGQLVVAEGNVTAGSTVKGIGAVVLYLDTDTVYNALCSNVTCPAPAFIRIGVLAQPVKLNTVERQDVAVGVLDHHGRNQADQIGQSLTGHDRAECVCIVEGNLHRIELSSRLFGLAGFSICQRQPSIGHNAAVFIHVAAQHYAPLISIFVGAAVVCIQHLPAAGVISTARNHCNSGCIPKEIGKRIRTIDLVDPFMTICQLILTGINGIRVADYGQTKLLRDIDGRIGVAAGNFHYSCIYAIDSVSNTMLYVETGGDKIITLSVVVSIFAGIKELIYRNNRVSFNISFQFLCHITLGRSADKYEYLTFI